MSQGKICQRKDCRQYATHMIVAELRVTANGPMAIAGPFVYVCEAHSQETSWPDIINGQGWALICAYMQSMGKQRPVREFSNLKVLPMSEEQKRSIG